MYTLKSIFPSSFRRLSRLCAHPCIQTLVFLLICRLLAMYFIPLNDSTEARYAEIARKMLETGNWVTPLHDYGVPFWAKPPLSTWLSAFSMKLFGINEMAVRLPSLLLSFGILRLVWVLGKKRGGIQMAWNAVFVLSVSLAFILNAGAVMTDAALLLSVMLVMTAFWLAVMEEIKGWRYLFFIGIGLGLLAKGPIILVLTGIPIFVWIVSQRTWGRVWEKLPWFKGTGLVLLIALPWYLLAEHRTPGFLRYFIVGEHLSRFLEPGWKGDKYGYAHQVRYGMIWIYGLFGLMPWTFLAPIWMKTKAFKASFTRERFPLPACIGIQSLGLDSHQNQLPKHANHLTVSWRIYLICFTLTPFAFFSFARNIIYPYILPSLPAFALYFVGWIKARNFSQQFRRDFVRVGIAFGSIILLITSLFLLWPSLITRSQKPIVTAWQKHHPDSKSFLIYWDVKPHFSAQFYTHGHATATLDPQVLAGLLDNQKDNYLVLRTNPEHPLPIIPGFLQDHLSQIGAISIRKENYTLYH